MTPLKIVFAGTPDFAETSLQALLDSPHQVIAVLTQPDRPAGRGKKLHQSEVKQLALAHGIPVLQPENLKSAEVQEQLRELAPDVMVVVAYGLLIPQIVLDIPRLGCINVHGSLLPRWRGAAPVHRAIVAGDHESGVTIMQMEAGLDTGPMLLSARTAIHDDDTGGSLYQRIAELGAATLVQALDDLPNLQKQARPQPEQGVSYAHKLKKDEAWLDWQRSSDELYNQIRAFNPWPVAQTRLGETTLRIWEATRAEGQGAPGTILSTSEQGIEVATGDGSLLLTRLQLPGKKQTPVADLLRGHAELFSPGRLLA